MGGKGPGDAAPLEPAQVLALCREGPIGEAFHALLQYTSSNTALNVGYLFLLDRMISLAVEGKSVSMELLHSVYSCALVAGAPLDLSVFEAVMVLLGESRGTMAAAKVWNDMKRCGISPSLSAYQSIVLVFIKAGKPENALIYLEAMVDKHPLPLVLCMQLMDALKETTRHSWKHFALISWLGEQMSTFDERTEITDSLEDLLEMAARLQDDPSGFDLGGGDLRDSDSEIDSDILDSDDDSDGLDSFTVHVSLPIGDEPLHNGPIIDSESPGEPGDPDVAQAETHWDRASRIMGAEAPPEPPTLHDWPPAASGAVRGLTTKPSSRDGAPGAPDGDASPSLSLDAGEEQEPPAAK